MDYDSIYPGIYATSACTFYLKLKDFFVAGCSNNIMLQLRRTLLRLVILFKKNPEVQTQDSSGEL